MRNDIIVEKMIQIVERILLYCGNLDYETFSGTDMVVEACVFNLEQLGEQANRIDEEFEKRHPEIPWRQIYGLRNRIVHDYEGVNLNLVWEIISSDLPDLLVALKNL